MAYATVEEVRAEGVAATHSDDRIQGSLDLWTQFIERVTRNFFEPRACTLDMDGNDSAVLFLPVPVITVSQLFVNDDFTTVVSPTMYKIYNGREQPRDDRWNPKIKLIRQGTIYSPPRTRWGPNFLKGVQNQRVIGTFGFTEADGTTPLAIKRALLKLVVNDLRQQGSSGLSGTVGSSRPAGNIMQEITDGHSIMYDTMRTKPIRSGYTSITGDPSIDQTLAMYRAPIIVRVPGSDWVFSG